MPRKTKETVEEKTTKTPKKINEKINDLIKNVLEPEEKVSKAKKTSAKEKAPEKSKKETKSTDKKSATKKATTAKVEKNDKEKKTAKKSAIEDKTATTKKARKTATKKVTKPTVSTKAKSVAPAVVEYYDLPYKYNQTVVKVLYQNPTTLFVYWEISDEDVSNYKAIYGDDFFETTRPVLVVYNDTMNYSFEININDFANSWYFNINDSKCDYRVELIRRPVFYNEKIKTDYVYISSSNKIETPNDKILFSTNEPYTVYFRNIKNNTQRKVILPKLLEQLNLTNKDFGFPIVRNIYDLYKSVYHIDNVGEFSIDLTNPSSRGGNPSSHSLSSRFI